MTRARFRAPETHVIRRDPALRSPAHSNGPPLLPDAAPRPARPSLLSRAGKYALVVSGLCATVGAAEGALTGYMLASNHGDAGGVIFAIAMDRFLLLGLVGLVIGTVIGAVDWWLAGRKKKQPS
jgi:hypothetical protein